MKGFTLFFLAIQAFSNTFSKVEAQRQGANLRRELIEEVVEDNSDWTLFTNFQERFSKKYESLEELEYRFQNFNTNMRKIVAHNSQPSTNFTMGINIFSDLTPSEFKAMYASGFKRENLGSYGCKTFSSAATGAPSAVDWRTKNVVNPVRDQGQCGSCWSFATTSNAESVWAINKGQLLDLSEQYLVDCAKGVGYGNLGCNGGQMDSAFKYMINYGQCAESAYPYTSGATQTAGTCHTCSSPQTDFTYCSDVKPNDQVSLKGAVLSQPVVVAIEADTRYFQSYSGGILTDASCGTKLDHAVEIVGYGVDNGIKYWNVRNSWGTSWGEGGYVRIARSDSTNDAGVCGIEMEPSYISV